MKMQDHDFSKNPVLLKAAEFVKSCKGKRTAILFDKDLDGACSGRIIYEALKFHGTDVDEDLVFTLKASTVFNHEFAQKLLSHGVQCLVTCDISFDASNGHLRDFASMASVMVVDHHRPEKPFDNLVFVNSALFQQEIPSYRYCTSKLAYDIAVLSGATVIRWKAVLGMIADMCDGEWPSFCSDAYKEIPREFIVSLMEKFDFARMEGLENTRRIFTILNTGDIKAVEGKYSDYFEVAERNRIVFDKLVKKFEEKHETFEDVKLKWFEFKTRKEGVASLLSNKASFEYPNYTLLLVNVDNERAKISLRHQDGKRDMNVLIREVVKTLPDSNGGGHKPASGCSCPIDSLPVLKERVIELLKKGFASA